MNRLLLECAAAQILIDFRGALEPACMSHTFRGWKCTVLIEPDPASIPIIRPEDIPLPVERDIVETIRDAGRRMLQPEIVRSLANDHGEGTVNRALARMVKSGKLTHAPRRGYDIPERGA